jgi:hydrogenase/urease accessory protein HupE
MKSLLTSKYKLAILSLILTPLLSTPALAHPGHLSNDAVHGFLHVEHIIALLAIGMAVYLVKAFRGK